MRASTSRSAPTRREPASRLRLFAALFALGTMACGGSAAEPPTAPDAALDVGEDAAVDASGEVRPRACDEVDQKLQAAVDSARKKAPNAILGVQDDACGARSFVSGDPATATTETLWRMGSVTKTFVAAVMFSLEKEGKLALEDPLAKWVEGVPKTEGVTVKMLLNHTSGIFNYTEDPAFFADRKKKWTPREIVDFATKNDPYFAPGADFHYSNTNYVLLGMIAEKAGGAKIGPLVRARAIEKAGLTATFFDGEEPVVGTMTRGFAGARDVTFVADMSGPWAAGAMVATGADLARWVAALYGSDRVLDASSRAKMLADPVSGGSYAQGVMILPPERTLGGGRALGHNGGIDGFVTMAYWFEGKRTAIAAVVNLGTANPNDIVVAAAKVLF